MKRFEGKTALVTGGTTGIGFATAKLLQAEGGKVAVTGRNPDSLAAARKELGVGIKVIASDAGSLSDIERLAKEVEDHLGQVDLLFVNAGIARFVPFEGVTEAMFDETVNVNLKGAYFTIQKLAPLIRRGGSIVLNTTAAGQKGMATTSFYAMSKAGLRSLARTLSTELLPKGVRVNAVSPGPITTPIFDKLGLTEEQKAGARQQFTDSNPMKRFGQAEEVARAVLFLATDARPTPPGQSWRSTAASPSSDAFKVAPVCTGVTFMGDGPSPRIRRARGARPRPGGVLGPWLRGNLDRGPHASHGPGTGQLVWSLRRQAEALRARARPLRGAAGRDDSGPRLGWLGPGKHPGDVRELPAPDLSEPRRPRLLPHDRRRGRAGGERSGGPALTAVAGSDRQAASGRASPGSREW